MDRFTRTFTIRWADCDANGHLRNTCYSEYAIEVRMAALTAGGFGFPEMKAANLGPVLLREEVDYLRECHMGETLTVTVSLLGLSPDGARWRFGHEVLKASGKVAARLVVSGAWMDLAARKLAPPPDQLRAIFDGVARGEEFEVLKPLRAG